MNTSIQRLVLALTCGLAALNASAATPVSGEVLGNGDFSAGMSHWQTPPSLAWWNPLRAEGGGVSLHPDERVGLVLQQPLHITVAADATVAGALWIQQLWAPEDMSTLRIDLLVGTGAGVDTLPLLAPANAAVATEAPGSELTFGPLALPAGSNRILGLLIHKLGPGEFVLHQASLQVSAGTQWPVPVVTGISSDTGPYGSEVILRGTDFGATPGTVHMGGSADGVTILAWANQKVVVRIGAPARSGTVTLRHAAGVDAFGRFAFTVTDPWCRVDAVDMVEGIIGELLACTFEIAFHNGFAPPAEGLALRVSDAAGQPVFWAGLPRDRAIHPGGYLALLDTTGLSAGVHYLHVEAADATGVVARSLPVALHLHATGHGYLNLLVQNPDWTYDTLPIEGDTLQINRQGEIQLYFDFVPAGGFIVAPNRPIGTVQSGNPGVVNVIHVGKIWENYVFFALRPGTAVLTFTAPDGFQRQLTVTVDLPETPRIEAFGATPSVVTNSGSDTVQHYATGTDTISIGVRGFAPWPWDDPDSQPQWSNGNKTVQLTARIAADADLGTVILTNGIDGAAIGLPLTVVNAPQFAGMEMWLHSHGYPPGMPSMGGTINLYDPAAGAAAEPVHQFHSVGHGSLYSQLGGIAPGPWKIGMFDWDGAGVWLDQAPDWAASEPLQLAAGAMPRIDMVDLARRIRFTAHALTVGRGVGSARLEVIRDGVDSSLSIPYGFRSLGAVEDVDFTNPKSPEQEVGTLDFDIGVDRLFLDIPILANAAADLPLAFSVSLLDFMSYGTHVGEPRTVVVTILPQTPPPAANPVWEDAAPAAGDWLRTDWLGYLQPVGADGAYAYHPGLGWIAVYGVSEAAVRIHVLATGTWYFASSLMPGYLYRFQPAGFGVLDGGVFTPLGG